MVDQNPESIEVMTARYAKAGLGNVRFVELTHQLAFVAQRIEHLTTDQKVGGSSPSKRTEMARFSRPRHFFMPRIPFRFRSIFSAQVTI